MNNEKPATERQKRFATLIAQTLKIPMPSRDSRIEYSRWIITNIDEFHKCRDEDEAPSNSFADFDTVVVDTPYNE